MKIGTISRALIVASSLLAGAERSAGQHADVLVQSLNQRLTAGSANFDTGRWTLGARVYRSEFDSDFAVNNPGFNALASGSAAMPIGAAALPGNAALRWDFLPMKIDGVTANLFYWDGLGATAADVDFGPPPAPAYKLSLFGKNAAVGVDGATANIPGDVIDDTSSTGAIHRHRFFALDDGDGDSGTVPADGIYLISLRMTMTGTDRSAPIYFVWGTPGSTFPALLAAESWAEDRSALLAPDDDPDFDGDLDVEGADFLAWQRGFGATAGALQIAGDADRDDAIGAGDLTAWSSKFGATLATFPGATSEFPGAPVPEPSLGAACWAAALAWAGARGALANRRLIC